MAANVTFRRSAWKPYGGYLLATLAIMAPLLWPGYILTLDMVFTPTWHMPQTLTSSYPLYAGLHFLNLIVPGQVIQKLILLAIPLLASIGMHRLIRYLQQRLAVATGPGIYIASLFFAINPFTYSRFMAGQYIVLLGYALLPWVVLSLLRFARQPTLAAGVRIGLFTAIVGAVSIHTLGLIAVLAISGSICWAAHRSQAGQGRAWWRQWPAILTALGSFLLASSYWLVPLLAGRGRTADIVTTITARDFSAFAVTGSTIGAQIWHILSLQGLWSEARELYLLPQTIFPVWYLFVLLLWTGVAGGAVWLWRHWRSGFWWLTGSIAASLCLALGMPLRWLAAYVPVLGGFREPHKFVGIICLFYAVLLAFGIPALLKHFRRRAPTTHALTLGAWWVLPFALAPTMLWGFAGQLQPRHYPASWYQANQLLDHDSGNFRVLLLPWHQYMLFGFADRTIAHPARQFFDRPAIVSSNPELKGAVATSATATTAHMDDLLKNAAHNPNFARQLAATQVKYILLTHDADYRDYRYLDTQPGLRRIRTDGSLTIYRNTLYKPQGGH